MSTGHALVGCSVNSHEAQTHTLLDWGFLLDRTYVRTGLVEQDGITSANQSWHGQCQERVSLERLRHDHSRTLVARSMEASAQPDRELQQAQLLDVSGSEARHGGVPRHVHRRHPRPLRRLQRSSKCRPGIGFWCAVSGQRPALLGACHGGGDQESHLWRDRQHDLRASLCSGPALFDSGSSNRRSCRMEHRYFVSRERGQELWTRHAN